MNLAVNANALIGGDAMLTVGMDKLFFRNLKTNLLSSGKNYKKNTN